MRSCRTSGDFLSITIDCTCCSRACPANLSCSAWSVAMELLQMPSVEAQTYGANTIYSKVPIWQRTAIVTVVSQVACARELYPMLLQCKLEMSDLAPNDCTGLRTALLGSLQQKTQPASSTAPYVLARIALAVAVLAVRVPGGMLTPDHIPCVYDSVVCALHRLMYVLHRVSACHPSRLMGMAVIFGLVASSPGCQQLLRELFILGDTNPLIALEILAALPGEASVSDMSRDKQLAVRC